MASRARVLDLAISESGFVFDPRTGDIFTVNETARDILKLLGEGLSEADIVVQLGDRFDTEAGDDAARDVAEFLATLRDLGLVNGEEQEA